jgi:hypothetical protein
MLANHSTHHFVSLTRCCGDLLATPASRRADVILSLNTEPYDRPIVLRLGLGSERACAFHAS